MARHNGLTRCDDTLCSKCGCCQHTPAKMACDCLDCSCYEVTHGRKA